ncbi:MAG: multiheme c-type cytochrome [Myxococcota bacterium]
MRLLLLLAGCTGKPDLELLQDPQACSACHPDHHTEWSGSMHAYASEDPLFRALNAIGQRETNGALGDFCVQCHAPLAVRLGLTDDGLNLDDIPENLQGVGCYFCHVVDGVDGQSNNPLSLSDDGVMRGPFDDPVANRFHASKYSPLLDRTDPRSSSLCGSCHDIVTPRNVHIERTFFEWQNTLFADEAYIDQNLNCSGCHMNGVTEPVAVQGNKEFPERRRHEHTWPAVDVALTDFPERDTQRALVQAELDSVLNPQLCVSIDPVGGDATLTVDLENLAAGHSFPSGAAADRRVWVEVIAYQDGQEVYASGKVPDGVSVAEAGGPDVWEIRDWHADERGQETHFFWEVEQVRSELLPGPTARLPDDPNWTETHRIRTYTVEEAAPDRVTMKVRLRPFGLDIFDSIADEGLDPALRSAIPTFELAGASLEWTADLGRACVR